MLEIGYQGNKGTHLNVNLRTTSVRDPLGRHVNPNDPNSAIINVPLATVLAPYAGFTQLFQNYNSAANSIRHAGYINLQRRMGHGLNGGVNYTFQKTLTDASDSANCAAGCGVGHRTWTQISYGATYQKERSVAAFNQPHVSSANASYDLPVGRGQFLLANAGRLVDRLAGGRKISALGTMTSGSPFTVALQDDNLLGAVNSGSGNTMVRPNVVLGVPLKNPNWSKDCAYGAACGPYINPAAFVRPDYGRLGNAPSVLPWLYAPMRKYLDMTLMKTVRIGDGKKTVQLRVDAFNVFNYRGNSISANNSFSGAWHIGAPSTADMPLSTYNGWASASNASHPNDQAPVQVSGQPNNQAYQQVVNITAQVRGANNGVLPTNFFIVTVPANMSMINPNTFDIRTVSGVKLYQIRNAYNTSWGTFSDLQNARNLQLSIRFTF